MAANKPAVKVADAQLGLGKFFGGLILILVVAAVVLFVSANRSASQPSIQAFANSGENVPTEYSGSLSQGNVSSLALSSLIASNINSTSTFYANYTGMVYIKPAGTAGDALGTVSSPAYLWIAQQNGTKRLSITATSVSLAGLLNVQYLLLSNSSYVCANFNFTAASRGNAGAIISKTPVCESGNSIGGVNLSMLYGFNFSQLAGLGATLAYQNSYQSTYNGTPCTVITGAVSGSDGNGSFIICMSDTYHVPLSMGMALSGRYGNFTIVLNETKIGNNLMQNENAYLPYPLAS